MLHNTNEIASHWEALGVAAVANTYQANTYQANLAVIDCFSALPPLIPGALMVCKRASSSLPIDWAWPLPANPARNFSELVYQEIEFNKSAILWESKRIKIDTSIMHRVRLMGTSCFLREFEGILTSSSRVRNSVSSTRRTRSFIMEATFRSQHRNDSCSNSNTAKTAAPRTTITLENKYFIILNRNKTADSLAIPIIPQISRTLPARSTPDLGRRSTGTHQLNLMDTSPWPRWSFLPRWGAGYRRYHWKDVRNKDRR